MQVYILQISVSTEGDEENIKDIEILLLLMLYLLLGAENWNLKVILSCVTKDHEIINECKNKKLINKEGPVLKATFSTTRRR